MNKNKTINNKEIIILPSDDENNSNKLLKKIKQIYVIPKNFQKRIIYKKSMNEKINGNNNLGNQINAEDYNQLKEKSFNYENSSIVSNGLFNNNGNFIEENKNISHNLQQNDINGDDIQFINNTDIDYNTIIKKNGDNSKNNYNAYRKLLQSTEILVNNYIPETGQNMLIKYSPESQQENQIQILGNNNDGNQNIQYTINQNDYSYNQNIKDKSPNENNTNLNEVIHNNDINISYGTNFNYNPKPSNLNYNQNRISQVNEIEIIQAPATVHNINDINNLNRISRESELFYESINNGQIIYKNPINYNNNNSISQQTEIYYNNNKIPFENQIVYNNRISYLNEIPNKYKFNFNDNNQIIRESQLNYEFGNKSLFQPKYFTQIDYDKNNNNNFQILRNQPEYKNDNIKLDDILNPRRDYPINNRRSKKIKRQKREQIILPEKNIRNEYIINGSMNEIDPNILEQYILYKELENNDLIQELKKENKKLRKSVSYFEKEREKFNLEKKLFLESRERTLEDNKKKEAKLRKYENDLNNKYLEKEKELKVMMDKLNEGKKAMNNYEIKNILDTQQNEINNKINHINNLNKEIEYKEKKIIELNNKYNELKANIDKSKSYNKNFDIQDNDNYPENNLEDIKDNDDFPENNKNNNFNNEKYDINTIQNNQFMAEYDNEKMGSGNKKNDVHESTNDFENFIKNISDNSQQIENNSKKEENFNENNLNEQIEPNEQYEEYEQNDLNEDNNDLNDQIYPNNNQDIQNNNFPDDGNNYNNNLGNQNNNKIEDEEQLSGNKNNDDTMSYDNKNELSEENNNVDEIIEDLVVNEYNPCLGLLKIENPICMNAVIQCFSHIPEITNCIINIHADTFFKNKLSKKNLEFLRNYRKVLINLFFPEKVLNINKNPYMPNDFRISLYNVNPLFKENEYIKIEDFLDFLIKKLHSDLNTKNNNEIIINKNLNSQNESDVLAAFLQDFANKNNSCISKTLYGIFKTTFYCHQCQNNFYNYDSYYYLSFNISKVLEHKINKFKKDVEDLDIMDCLDYFQRTETLLGDRGIFCPICGRNTESSSIKNIYSSRTVLIFYLDRNNNNNDIDESNINFDYKEKINLRDYVQYKKEENKVKEKYFLSGVVNYYEDNYGNGNYKAYCKMGKNNVWYCYDNENVYPIDFKDIKNNGYPVLLFYHKL